MKPQETKLNSHLLKQSALAMAMAAVVPLQPALAAESKSDVKELAVTQATAQAEESYKVDQSTSSKYTQPLVNTAKSITVISESVMKDRNVDSLRDALRTVPGISLAAGEGGTPSGDSMSIRGFDARNSIMIDGVRDIAGYYRDTYNVEAIEVAKGPGSSVYGRGSTGGSINLATKTAKLENFNDIGLRLGTENDYRAKLDSNVQLGETTALRINLLSDKGDVAGRDQVFNGKNALALSLATGLGTDSRFSVNAEIQQQENLPDYGIPWVGNSATSDPVAELADYEGSAPPVDFDNFYGNLSRDFENIDAQSLTAIYEKDLTSNTSLRTLFRTGSVERQSIVTAPRFISLTTSTDVRMSDEKTRDTKDSLNVFQAEIIGNYLTGNIEHDVVVGAEIAKEKFDRWNYIDVVDDNLDSTPVLNDLYNPNPNLEFTGRYARGDKMESAEGDTIAAYFFDTLKLNSQWQLSLGLRLDSFETNYLYDLDGSDPTLELTTKDNTLSWNLGAVYKPRENGSIYFGAGTSFNPSAEDLTASSNGNNADLDPEETNSYELGTKWELFDNRLFASAAIFRTDKNHARTDDPYALDANDETLNGQQRVDGLELSATGQLTPELSITAAYTYQKGKVINADGADAEQEGAELPRTPKNSYSLWGRYEINSDLALGLGAQYIGERYNSSTPSTREMADDYLIYDLMLSYTINSQWSLQLNGSNLTDENYIDQVGGGHFIPGEGRYLSISTQFSF